MLINTATFTNSANYFVITQQTYNVEYCSKVRVEQSEPTSNSYIHTS